MPEGQFEGYEPFSIMVTPDLHKAGIAQFISERYPLNGKLFDWGAFVCTLMGILFHPIHFDLLGIADLATMFVALYGMLMIRKHTKNSWGCVFAFLFIWIRID